MKLKAGAVALTWFLFSAVSALAQTTTVKGIVKDPSGGMPGLIVHRCARQWDDNCLIWLEPKIRGPSVRLAD